jgi:hypothetical protein
MRVVYHIHGTAIIEFFFVRAKVEFKSFQDRGLVKDGECGFKTFPDCSLLSETI